MVQTITFIFMLLCFILTIYFSEKYIKKYGTTWKMSKILCVTICILSVLTILVMLLPVLFPILIYLSVIIASFVCTYSRHRFANKEELN